MEISPTLKRRTRTTSPAADGTAKSSPPKMRKTKLSPLRDILNDGLQPQEALGSEQKRRSLVLPLCVWWRPQKTSSASSRGDSVRNSNVVNEDTMPRNKADKKNTSLRAKFMPKQGVTKTNTHSVPSASSSALTTGQSWLAESYQAAFCSQSKRDSFLLK